MLFRVMVEDSDHCHKNTKSNVSTVVCSQMPACIYIPLPLLRSIALTKLKKKKNNLKDKKGSLDKSHEKAGGWEGEEISLNVLEKECN